MRTRVHEAKRCLLGFDAETPVARAALVATAGEGLAGIEVAAWAGSCARRRSAYSQCG